MSVSLFSASAAMGMSVMTMSTASSRLSIRFFIFPSYLCFCRIISDIYNINIVLFAMQALFVQFAEGRKNRLSEDSESRFADDILILYPSL